jgi:hypothetical protein
MMNKRTIMMTAVAFGAVGAIASAGAAAGSSNSASLVIRHQVKGCHEWSLNGGAYRVTTTVKLSRGGTLSITDNDMMPHQLVKLSGPAIRERLVKAGSPSMGKMKAPYAPGLMPHMGAMVNVTFTKRGTYKLRTKSLEDYMPIKTVGEDNVLRVTVVVG